MEPETKMKIVGVAAFAVLGLGVWFLLGDRYQITNYPPRGRVVVAFGDSLVSGEGATKGNDFVSRTSKTVGVSITNLGVPGDTTADGLARVDAALAREPDIVLILLGGNDAIRRLTMGQTESNLASIIRKFQAQGAVTVLLGVRGGLLGDPYDTMYERLAESTGSAYIPDVLDGLFADPRYMADAIHPNDEGYAIIAERVSKELLELLKAAK